VRVKLNALTESDMYRILTEPLGNLIRQHEAMFATEGSHSFLFVFRFKSSRKINFYFIS